VAAGILGRKDSGMTTQVEANLQRLNCPEWSRRLLVLSLVLSLGALLWVNYPVLSDRYRVVEDWRHFYWMARFRDPELFQDDPIFENYLIKVELGDRLLFVDRTNVGYSLLYYLISLVIEPIVLLKILPFVLMPISTIYLFLTGKLIKNNLTGFLLSALFTFFNLSSSDSISVASGLQRAFACPLLIILIYYLISHHFKRATIALIAGSLLYPPVFLIMALAYLLSFVRIRGWKDVDLVAPRRKALCFAVGIILSLVPLFPFILQASAVTKPQDIVTTEADSEYETESLMEDPRYQRSGRWSLFGQYLFFGRAGIVDQGGELLNLIPLLLIVSLIWMIRGRRALQLNIEIWYILLAGLMLFVLSWVFVVHLSSFLLYLPSRYTRCTIFLFALYFIAFNLLGFPAEAIVFLRKHRRSVLLGLVILEVLVIIGPLLAPYRHADRSVLGNINAQTGALVLGGTAALVVLGLLTRARRPTDRQRELDFRSPSSLFALSILVLGSAVALIMASFYMRTMSRWYLDPSRDERALFEFLASTPKKSLIAGAPSTLDSVQLFAQRQTLFSFERSTNDPAIALGLFSAYYAESEDEILGFCQEYGVDYLVVDQRGFTQDYLSQQRFFFEPYNDDIIAAVNGRTDFMLNNIPSDKKLFQSGPLFVVNCDEETFANLD
jgi:hypothetical protein